MSKGAFQITFWACAFFGILGSSHQELKAQGGVMVLGAITNNVYQPIIIPQTRESIFSPTVIVPPVYGGTETPTEVITGTESDVTLLDGAANGSSLVVTSPIPADPIVVTNVPSGFLPPDASARNPVPIEPPPLVTPPIPFGGTPFDPIQPPAVINPPPPSAGPTTPAVVNPPPALVNPTPPLPGNPPALQGTPPGLSSGQSISGPPPGPPPALPRAPGTR